MTRSVKPTTLVFLILLVIFWTPGPAAADPDVIVSVDEADLAEGEGHTSRTCSPPDQDHSPDATVTYREVGALDIELDVHKADSSIQGELGALIIVHGGGWFTGCKWWSSIIAEDIADGVTASPGFVVFNINYRLACETADDPDIEAYCGWPFNTPPTDVGYAVDWVRDNAETYLQTGQTWSDKVGLFGTSAGGNLSFLVATEFTGDFVPDAVAGWSGLPDMAYLSNGHAACADSERPDYCRDAGELYLGCSLLNCLSTWNTASPITHVTSGDPPTMIGNADGEISPLLAAEDFGAELLADSVPTDFCIVEHEPDEHPHGLGLRNFPCNDDDGSTYSRTMEFFDTWLSGGSG